MKKINSFIKNGEQITPKPQGFDYELINGKIYTLIEDHYTDELYLKESEAFIMPTKYYQNKDDVRFISKVINTFTNTEKITTGIMLSGTKGCGKTLMAKHIAMKANTPIIVLDKSVRASNLENFFARITIDVCIIIDELDKYWDTRYMLGFFDSVKPSGKKLIICTCNDEDEINEYLNDRCSRIRYKRTFENLGADAVVGILTDIIGEEKALEVASFLVDNINVISYDNVLVFGDEVKNNPDESLEDILNDLNIEKK